MSLDPPTSESQEFFPDHPVDLAKIWDGSGTFLQKAADPGAVLREVADPGQAVLQKRARINGLDGIRTLAIIGVIAYHLGLHIVPGGYLGVDTFFALSGYLITGLLLDKISPIGLTEMKIFWARRIRRLLPGLMLMLVAVNLYVYFSGLSSAYGTLTWDSIASLFYFANWRYLFTQSNYFDISGHPSPLIHTWSLSIEEQFYIVWPLLIFILVKLISGNKNRMKALMAISFIGAVLSLWDLNVVYFHSNGILRTYYSTDTRAQSILLGCCLCLFMTLRNKLPGRSNGLLAEIAGGVGLVGTIVLFLQVHESSAVIYRYGFGLAALCAVLLIYSITQSSHSLVSRLLSFPPITYLGRISYELYLWHWPVIVFLNAAKTSLHGTPLLLVRLGAMVVIASLTYHLIEVPIRTGQAPKVVRAMRARASYASASYANANANANASYASASYANASYLDHKPRTNLGRFHSTVLVGGLIVVIICALLNYPSASSESAIASSSSAIASSANPSLANPSLANPSAAAGNQAPSSVDSRTHGKQTPQQRVAAYLERIGILQKETRVMIVGDSMAFTLGIGMGYVAQHNNVWFSDNGIRNCSVSTNGPFIIQGQQAEPASPCLEPASSPTSWENLWKDWIDEFNPDVVVYLARLDIVDQYHNGIVEHIGEVPFDNYLSSQLTKAISIMDSRGAHVVLMTDPYYDSGEQPNGNGWPEDAPIRVKEYNSLLNKLASQDPGKVSVMDLNELISPGGTFTSSVDGVTVRSADGVHFTVQGGKWIGNRTLAELSVLGRAHHLASASQPLVSPPIKPSPALF